jgi:thioester reductase-like protein
MDDGERHRVPDGEPLDEDRYMTVAVRPALGTTQERLTAIVASILRTPPQWLSTSDSFAALGLDSLGAVELVAAIEDEMAVKLPLTAAHDYPSIDALARFIECGGPIDGSRRGRDLMLADAVLPADIQPRVGRTAPVCEARDVLLTGATGFLGAYLLRTLLDETGANIHCAVRARVGARERVLRNLREHNLVRPRDDARIHIVHADLAKPMLGMSARGFAALGEGVDAIYHCGATVNWVYGYGELRDANVLGTRELLRLACAGAKPFHFVSSISVCHSTSAPATVDESFDALASLDGVHLGYAQSKCVAEALVRQAAERGLPATIVRPSLVTGDVRSGRSNVDDLTSRLVAGCVRLGAAPDLDWRMDCVPVDETARAIVRLTRGQDDGLAVLHLASDRPRHWRECVFWMRLAGYEVDLVPYREWLARLMRTRELDHPLFPLRAFFGATIADESGLTLPELFEDSRQPRVTSVRTRATLSAAGVSLTPIDVRVLARYFDDYVARGAIPDAPRRSPATTSSSTPVVSLGALSVGLSRQLGRPLAAVAIELKEASGDESIIAELTGWQSGVRVGLMRGRVSYVDARGVGGTTPIFIKSKSADEQSIEVAEALGRMLSPSLGTAIETHRDSLGITRSHLRELAIYSDDDPRVREHRPAALAIERDDDRRRWVLALEAIDDAVLIDALSPSSWTAEAIDAALAGLAQIHARWFDADASQFGWLPPIRDTMSRTDMAPLWRALTEHAVSQPAWRDPRLRALHRALADDVAGWSRELDVAPRTIIHNDFNPRNIAIRRRDGRLTLCAFDWELATLGAPQRDLAEFLCFVLPPDASHDTIRRWVERYRTLFSEAARTAVEPASWERGFSAALCDLLVDRLAMLAMIDRVRSQRYLSRVVAAWLNAYDCFPLL